MRDFFRDCARNGMQQSRRCDGFAKHQSARSEDDNGPEKIVEVFFRQNSCAEEKHDWDDSNDAHVAKDAIKLVAETPEDNRDEGRESDEPLRAGEMVFDGPNGDDGCAAAGFEADE